LIASDGSRPFSEVLPHRYRQPLDDIGFFASDRHHLDMPFLKPVPAVA